MKFSSKIFTAIILGMIAVGSMSLSTTSVTRSNVLGIGEFNQSAADPLAFLFHILFWLFFISPPIIVILLFLIWKELKARNKMK